MEEIWSALMTALEEQANDISLQLVVKYKTEEQNRDKYVKALITIYENEITNLQAQGEGLQTLGQKQIIDSEVKKLEECANIRYRNENSQLIQSYLMTYSKGFRTYSGTMPTHCICHRKSCCHR